MLRYDFKYRPVDPDAYQKLMDLLGPSIARSPSLLDKPKEGRKRNGRVKWFNAKRGYGFIAQDEQGAEDIFVHFSAIRGDGFRSLNAGDRVVFGVEETDKGLRAVNVSVVDKGVEG